MAKQLNLDEMLEVLNEVRPDVGERFQSILESTGTIMAQTIAAALDVDCGEATFQGTGFAGTCAPFMKKTPEQECPSPLDLYDEAEWD